MGKPSNEIIASTGGIAQEEWLRDESEHPYKFVPTKASGNTVSFPAITKCNTYILHHCASSIVEEIGQRMYDGDLAMYFDTPDFTEDCIDAELSALRLNEIQLCLRICRERVDCDNGRQAIYFCHVFKMSHQVRQTLLEGFQIFFVQVLLRDTTVLFQSTYRRNDDAC